MQLLQLLKNSKRSRKGPFCYILGPPESHPGNGISGARRGRSPPPPGFSSHDSDKGIIGHRAVIIGKVLKCGAVRLITCRGSGTGYQWGWLHNCIVCKCFSGIKLVIWKLISGLKLVLVLITMYIQYLCTCKCSFIN